jgi:deoxyribodipyrimidine photo-lyase
MTDNAILANATGQVLPIFIFDSNILNKLPKSDKRVTFIYNAVLQLKADLQSINLDLAIFYDTPTNVFRKLHQEGYDEVLCSPDFDEYALKRDEEVAKILPLRTFLDAFLIHPTIHLKKDNTPYKVFTPFYKALWPLWQSDKIEPYVTNNNLKLIPHLFEVPSLDALGFEKQILPSFLYQSGEVLLQKFIKKIENYEYDRDYFALDASSNLGVHLRFGLISSKQIFNTLKALPINSEPYIRQLFWREFYNYILYHYPQSQTQNFNGIEIIWNENEEWFEKWCQGETGVPIVDAAMKHLNETGCMHNRLRMVTASFLTKNLFLDWKKGEAYFALKLLDYEASSNIGSWQWSASTGADAVPYFRVFNPYAQSKKFDKEAIFIKSILSNLQEVPSAWLHQENGFDVKKYGYVKPLVNAKESRARAIEAFKRAKY